MKLHYKGKYDLNPDSFPHNEHKPNAVTQMPKGARTYMHKFNSFWYMPE